MPYQYDTSFEKRDNDPKRWARYGLPWTQEERSELHQLFCSCMRDLETLCVRMGRPSSGVLAKLVDMRLLRRESGGWGSYQYVYYLTGPMHEAVDELVNRKPKKEKPEMTDIKITTKTLIGGVEATELSDEQVYNLIARKEEEVRKWETIKHRPTKLQKLMDQAEADIAALVAFVDAR